MAKRTRIDIGDIAGFKNLAAAAVRAGRGKRSRSQVIQFFSQFDLSISRLREDILDGRVPYGILKTFIIRDPKKRTIHAACFEDRVLHHALIRYLGPVLERALCASTFACLSGRGPLAGINRVQKLSRRYPWFVKIDMYKYFDSIDHDLLLCLLQRKYKGHGLADLLAKIVRGYSVSPGFGLPIGSLTSQHFANYYLDGFDRFLLEKLKVCGHVRYMDDVVWWCRSREEARKSLAHARCWLVAERHLTLHDKTQINRSGLGVNFCGFRILPGMLKLSRRRRIRYCAGRVKLETAFRDGALSTRQLQTGFSSVLAVTAHGDSRAWRCKQLQANPAPDC